jgi:(R,R)-butanediol dehydrogenase / meso-butanediol dehydrogenase / diacetyl reductase
VIEASGSPAGLATALRAVRRGGKLVALGLPAAPPEIDLVDAVLREVDIITTVAHVCDTDLPRALELLGDPALAAAAIERLIPIGDIVGAGLGPLAEGRATGKIVVDVRG